MSDPVVLASVKSGAGSPTSTALAGPGPTATTVSPSTVASSTTPTVRLIKCTMSASSPAKVSVFVLGGCVLLLPSHLPRDLEYVLAGEDGVVRDQPLPPNDPPLIHQEERPTCSRIRSMLDHRTAVLHGANLVGPQDAVIPDNLEVRRVAEERVRELKRLRERLLCEGVVSADPENLHVQVPEPAIVDLPG